MTRDEARGIVRDCLGEIAPEADVAALAGDADLRAVLDLDSMDVLELVSGIATASGTTIPDREVARLRTLDEFAERLL